MLSQRDNAGARFMTIRSSGRMKPELTIARSTRCVLSLTAASGKPTSMVFGSAPAETSTSTSTPSASMPNSENVRSLASMERRQRASSGRVSRPIVMHTCALCKDALEPADYFDPCGMTPPAPSKRYEALKRRIAPSTRRLADSAHIFGLCVGDWQQGSRAAAHRILTVMKGLSIAPGRKGLRSGNGQILPWFWRHL